MLSRIARLFSSSFPVVIQSSLDMINSISVSPFNEEKANQLIKTYFHLCFDIRSHRVIINWNSHPTIRTSISMLTPVINKVDSKNLNSLIVSLNFLGIDEISIWRKLEEQFVKTAHTSADISILPQLINGFNLSKSNNPMLWNILFDKIIQELPSSNCHLGIVLLTYKTLLLCQKGTKEVIKKLKERIIADINNVNFPMIAEILSAMSRYKSIDRELTSLFLYKILQNLDEFEPNYLCAIIVDLYILRENKETIKKLENKVIERLDGVNLKTMSNLICTYRRPSMVKSGEGKDFAKKIYQNYLIKRNLLKHDIEKKETLAHYDIRIFGTAIELGFNIPEQMIMVVYSEIKKLNLFMRPTDITYGMFNSIEKYVKFISIKPR